MNTETETNPIGTLERLRRCEEALRPFAAMAPHFPMNGRGYGNRPKSGTIYSVSSVPLPDAEITVEHLHAAAALTPMTKPEQEGV